MMSIHRVSMGDGYEYYTREVASADERLKRGEKIGDYYLNTGVPAGVWMGSSLHHFALAGEVTEEQMRDLYGMGKRPDAAELRRKARGLVDERKLNLGQQTNTYTLKHEAFRVELGKRIDAFHTRYHRAPSKGELKEIRYALGRETFVTERKRAPLTEAELSRFITAKLTPTGASVAGFDCTFSAPKSVSVMWGLGDRGLQKEIEAAHLEAIETALAFMEKEVISSRAGRNGVRRVATEGVVAARFRHYDSRAGDPQLHDHVVIANRVFCPNGKIGADGKPLGKWRTIDSKALYKSVVAASERYNDALMHALHMRLGLTFETRTNAATGSQKMEIAGVSDVLIGQFSSRRAGIEERLQVLENEYRMVHGRAPSRKVHMRLAQQATLETRQRKEHVGLADRVQSWREQTPMRYTLSELVAAKEAAAQEAYEGAQVDVEVLARQTIFALEKRRSTWTLRHVQAEAARQVAAATGGTGCTSEAIEHVVSAVLDDTRSVLLARPAPVLASALSDDAGVSIYEHKDMWHYTSSHMIDIEQRLLDATSERVGSLVDATTLTYIMGVLEREDGLALSPDQKMMVEHFVRGDRTLMTAVGPAGAGKTTAMKAATRAVQEKGHAVVGLAPSAVAAKQLGESIGAEAMTLQLWLTAEKWNDLERADMIIIDEAGMADAHVLDQVVEHARQMGASVRMVGDPMQLSTVDAGGTFRFIHEASKGVELDTIWRFKTHGEADASLNLRSGEDPFGWYLAQGRISGGADEEILASAFGAWSADCDKGLSSILIASSNERVSQLNDMAQSWRAVNGETHEAQTEVKTRDGQVIRLGERILTRKNDASLKWGRGNFVKNGDLFTVVDIHEDASLTVYAQGGVEFRLPASYVAAHVQLGYAATIQRSQGVTVDTSHAILDATCPRESAYVALTRGKENNQAWVVCEDAHTMSEVLDAIEANTTSDYSAHHVLAARLGEENSAEHQ